MPAMTQNSRFANYIGAFLTVFLCTATIYLIYIVTKSDLPDKTLSIVMYALGFLTGKLSTIVDWCFGSNSQSKTQSDTIATLTKTAAVAQDALTPGPTVPLQVGDKVTVSAEPEPPTT